MTKPQGWWRTRLQALLGPQSSAHPQTAQAPRRQPPSSAPICPGTLRTDCLVTLTSRKTLITRVTCAHLYNCIWERMTQHYQSAGDNPMWHTNQSNPITTIRVKLFQNSLDAINLPRKSQGLEFSKKLNKQSEDTVTASPDPGPKCPGILTSKISSWQNVFQLQETARYFQLQCKEMSSQKLSPRGMS